MDVQIPPVFYKTSSSFGAEALLTSKAKIDKSLSRQGKGTRDHLLPLGDWFRLSHCVQHCFSVVKRYLFVSLLSLNHVIYPSCSYPDLGFPFWLN